MTTQQFFRIIRYACSAATQGHSTTASIRVSKTLDRGSIPRAPAKSLLFRRNYSETEER